MIEGESGARRSGEETDCRGARGNFGVPGLLCNMAVVVAMRAHVTVKNHRSLHLKLRSDTSVKLIKKAEKINLMRYHFTTTWKNDTENG